MSEAGWNMPMGCSGSDPYFNQPDPPECPKCYVELDEDWRYCPYCGSENTFLITGNEYNIKEIEAM